MSCLPKSLLLSFLGEFRKFALNHLQECKGCTYIFDLRWFRSQVTRQEGRARSIALQASSPRLWCKMGFGSDSHDPREFSPLKNDVFYLVQLYWLQNYWFFSFSVAFLKSNDQNVWAGCIITEKCTNMSKAKGSKVYLCAARRERVIFFRNIEWIQSINSEVLSILFCVWNQWESYSCWHLATFLQMAFEWVKSGSRRNFRHNDQGSNRELWELEHFSDYRRHFITQVSETEIINENIAYIKLFEIFIEFTKNSLVKRKSMLLRQFCTTNIL